METPKEPLQTKPSLSDMDKIVVRHGHAILTMKIVSRSESIPTDATMVTVFGSEGPIEHIISNGNVLIPHLPSFPRDDLYAIVSLKTSTVKWSYVVQHHFSDAGYKCYLLAKIESEIGMGSVHVILEDDYGNTIDFEEPRKLVIGTRVVKVREIECAQAMLKNVVYIDCSPDEVVVRKFLRIKDFTFEGSNARHEVDYNGEACHVVKTEHKELDNLEVVFDDHRGPSTLFCDSWSSELSQFYTIVMNEETKMFLGGEQNILFVIGTLVSAEYPLLKVHSNTTDPSECGDPIRYSAFIGPLTPYVLLEDPIGSKVRFIVKK